MSVRRLSLLLLSCLAVSARGEVFDISAIISASQEVPSPMGVPASAGGFASVQLDDVTKELSWDVAWQDLSGPAVGMHFHAPAASGETAGVVVNIGAASGLVSPSIGSTIISDDLIGDLLGGLSYINIHTAANGPGEIRGQVSPTNVNLFATLDVVQEIPAPTGVPAEAGGIARIALDPATNLLGWNIAWENLSGPAVGMHFHGPASAGETAGVLVNVGNISGLTSPSIGSTVISDEFESQLLSGQWYLNIHTAANGTGEIRGQVVPEPGAFILSWMGILACVALRRTASPSIDLTLKCR